MTRRECAVATVVVTRLLTDHPGEFLDTRGHDRPRIAVVLEHGQVGLAELVREHLIDLRDHVPGEIADPRLVPPDPISQRFDSADSPVELGPITIRELQRAQMLPVDDRDLRQCFRVDRVGLRVT